MTLQASGAISMSQINTELGSNKNHLDDTTLRQLAQKTSGAIKFSDLYSKTGKFVGNITMNTTPSGSLSGTFYDSSFVQLRRESIGGNAELDFNFPGLSIFTGQIVVTNNTTAVSSTLAKVNSQNWQGSNPANLLRASTTDNFTIRAA